PVTFVFEIPLKEGEGDVLLEVLRCLRSELDVSEMRAIITLPATMPPGAYDQRAGIVRDLPFDRFVCRHLTVEIKRVEPAADVQHRQPDVFQRLEHVAPAVELVVVRMRE